MHSSFCHILLKIFIGGITHVYKTRFPTNTKTTPSTDQPNQESNRKPEIKNRVKRYFRSNPSLFSSALLISATYVNNIKGGGGGRGWARERERRGWKTPWKYTELKKQHNKNLFQSDLQRNRWRGEPKLLSRASFLFESFLKSKSVCDRNAEKVQQQQHTHVHKNNSRMKKVSRPAWRRAKPVSLIIAHPKPRTAPAAVASMSSRPISVPLISGEGVAKKFEWVSQTKSGVHNLSTGSPFLPPSPLGARAHTHTHTHHRHEPPRRESVTCYPPLKQSTHELPPHQWLIESANDYNLDWTFCAFNLVPVASPTAWRSIVRVLKDLCKHPRVPALKMYLHPSSVTVCVWKSAFSYCLLTDLLYMYTFPSVTASPPPPPHPLENAHAHTWHTRARAHVHVHTRGTDLHFFIPELQF